MKNIRKILIIRFSSIGDIVLATSPLNTIRNKYPSAKIDFLTLDLFKPLLNNHIGIDNVISFGRNSKLKALIKLRKSISNNGYDMIFDLHRSLRTKLLLLGFYRNTYRVSKPRFLRFLLFKFNLNYFHSDFSTIDMYHKSFTNLLDKDYSYPKTSLFINEGRLDSIYTNFESISKSKQYISLVPGAAWKQKQWSPEKYSILIDSIYKNTSFEVIMIGSRSDIICDEIIKLNDKVIPLNGKTTIEESLTILKISSHAIGSDTGMLHAAEALGVTITMIMGPTSTETGGGANLKSSNNIFKDIWCRPCSQNGSKACYRDKQYCMETISAEDVIMPLMESLSK